jgi:pimeloyl-ACP methyl ester carboxylesterase/DNA-binding winged helix-turn-helix (wHTH) protein
MDTVSQKTLGFDIYALDLQRCALLREGAELQLRPKSFDVLRYLAEHAGRLVPKEELIEAVWPGIFVTDDSVVQCIREIRAAISDDAHRVIKTIPRRGYLFAAKLSGEEPGKRLPSLDSRGQDITFCRTEDGVHVAVASVGQGMPLVCTPTWATHLEYDWESPARARLWHYLADRFRLIRYDGRGFGLSDRDVADISCATHERDLQAVVDALNLHHHALLAISGGAATAIAYAIRNPDRVSKMVLHGSFALGRNRRGGAQEAEIAKAWIAILRQGWADDNSALLRIFSSVWLPGATAEQISWYGNMLRRSTSVENAIRMRTAADEVDIVDLLPKVSVPTLVTHCRHDNSIPFEEGRRIATAIPNARLVSLDSENHVPLPGEPAWQKFVSEIEAFLTE